MRSYLPTALGGVGQRLTPTRVALLYAVFGFGLLVVSDLLLPRVVTDPVLLRELQAAKGAVEVLASAVLVYALVASAQRELRVKERALDEAPVGVTLTDPRREDNPLVYVNEGFERITGYPASAALGRNCWFLQGDHTAEEPVARLREAVDAERPASVELLNYRADGTPFWNRVAVVPVRMDGEVTRFLGIQRDVTERREREQRLSVLNRVLRHNLRNKLNVVLARLTRLEDPDADLSAETAAIREATEELLELTERVREFDAAIVGEEGATRTVDVGALLDGVVTDLRADHPATDVTVTGEDETGVAVEAHATLEAALEELLSLLGTGEHACCTVAVGVEERFVVLAVTDHGGRVPPEDLRVVARDAETPLEHLRGIELWLVRWAVERSNGEFAVEPGADPPVVRLRLRRADATDARPTDGE